MTVSARWNRYERVMLTIAHYKPDYSLTRRARDGVLRAPRFVFWLQWTLYAAALDALLLGVTAILDVHPPLALQFVAGVAPLWAVKIWSVIAVPEPRPLWHEWDWLDWSCDVGAFGSAGVLLTAQLLGGLEGSPFAYVAIALLAAITYAWSSP